MTVHQPKDSPIFQDAWKLLCYLYENKIGYSAKQAVFSNEVMVALNMEEPDFDQAGDYLNERRLVKKWKPPKGDQDTSPTFSTEGEWIYLTAHGHDTMRQLEIAIASQPHGIKKITYAVWGVVWKNSQALIFSQVFQTISHHLPHF